MALGVRNLLSQGIDKIRNSTTLDDKLISSVNSARNSFSNWQAQNRVNANKIRVPDVPASFVQGANEGAMGFTGLEKKLPIGPRGYKYTPQTTAGKAANFAGGAVGYAAGAGRLFGPAEKAISGAVKVQQLARTAPIVNRAANFVARKTLPALLAEGATALPTSYIQTQVDGSKFLPTYAENVAGSLAGRAVGAGAEAAAPYVKKAGKYAVQGTKQAVKETKQNQLVQALNQAYDLERQFVSQTTSGMGQPRNMGKYAEKLKLQTAAGGDPTTLFNKEIPLFKVQLPGKLGEIKLSASQIAADNKVVPYIKGPANDAANKVWKQAYSGGFIDLGAKIDRTKLSGRQLDMPNSKLTQKSPMLGQEMGGIGVEKSQSASIARGEELPYTATQTQGLPQVPPKTTLKTLLQGNQSQAPGVKINPSSEKIIQDGYKEIGSLKDEGKAPIKQKLSESWDKFYTDWVDRYNPITKATDLVEKSLAQKGAVLRPENNPKYVIRKFLGMGGIAEQRFQSELKPVLDLADKSGIAKQDLDLYLKSKRDINLSQRGIAGSDANIASQRVQALQEKYGQGLDQIANKMYEYQSKGFKELVDSGFISQDQAKQIQDLNQNYVPFQRVMDEVDEFLGIPTKKAVQSANPLQKIKGSEKQIYSPVESIIANTYKQRAAIEKNNVARSVADLAQSMPELGFKTVAQAGNDTIPVWRNGVKEYVQVGTEISDSLKGMNEEQMNNVLKLFTGPASILRQGATGRNPDFMIPNIIRDQLDAAINSKSGYVPFLDYARGFASVLKNDQLYREWQSSGASQDLSSLSGRKAVSDMLNEKKARKNLFQWIGKGLSVMGKYSEEPTRVGLYKKAKEKTGNKMLAMMESREGTMDFARMGAKMKVANAMIPFLNVGVQGFDKLIRSAKENPARFALKLGAVAALPQATVTAYNLTNHPEEYKDVPQYEKDGNFVIVTGRNDDGTVSYITIPKGNVAQLAANPVDSFMTFAAGRNSQTIGQFATQFLSSTLPVVAEGQSLKEIALKTVGSNLPQAVKPITENLLNKSFYKYNPDSEQSKEIVPQYIQKKAPGDQSYEWTPTLYKAVGKVAGVSPLQVQNLAEGYFAGYSKIPAQIVDILKSISEGKPVDPNQKTIIRRIFKQTYPMSESQKKKQAEATPLIGQASAAEGIPMPLPEFNRSKINQQINSKSQSMPELEKKYFTIDEQTRKDIKESVKNGKQVPDSSLTAAYLGKEITSSDTNTEYGKIIRRKAILGKIDNIQKDENLSPQQKARLINTAYGKAGLSLREGSYYTIAKKPEDEKYAIVKDVLSKTDKQGVQKTIGGMLYEVDGKKLLSNGVITSLVEDGTLTSNEGKYLKSLKFDQNTKSLKPTLGSKKSGFISDKKILTEFNFTMKNIFTLSSNQPNNAKKLSDYYANKRKTFKIKK